MPKLTGNLNFYSGLALDRAEHLRSDPTWLDERLARPESRFVAVWRGRNLVLHRPEPRAVLLERGTIDGLLSRAEITVFLGLNEEIAFFALDLSDLNDDEAAAAVAGHGAFDDLRRVGPLLERSEGAVLAYARGLVHWHRRHRFCGVCGGPTDAVRAGHQRRCRNTECRSEHFPRIDPAVIMLVHDGERCVLGRKHDWPPGRHSTLAGFVEPGESLEEAVAREVREEVGIAVERVHYHSSQPWPFPSSLMVGFFAEARPQALRVDPRELAGAGWFSREELRAAPENARLHLPRPDSIARRLIEDWLKGAQGAPASGREAYAKL